MRLLARALVHVFFRTTELQHGDRLPARGPVLLAANHTNGLVDGLLLLAVLDRYPRFLGKATLFRVPLLGWLLRLAGVVPVHRAKDGGTAGNDETFRVCRARLVDGGVVAIFPEGISLDEASLQPLRTGAARIALGAVDEGAIGLSIVPAGLAYDDKARFRSRALVTIGEPIAVVAGTEVRALTEELDRALRRVGPDYRSAAEAEELASIADVAAADEGLGGREDVARALAKVESDLADVRAAHAAYRRDLALLGLSDRQLTADVTPGRLRATVAWSIVRFVASAPIAAAGYLVHVVPYELMRQVSKRPRNEGVRSTVKVLGCMVLFPVVWSVLAVLAGSRWGWPWGLAVFAACPLAGYTTVRFVERVYRVGGLLRAWRTLRERGSTIDSVKANRARVVDLTRSATGS